MIIYHGITTYHIIELWLHKVIYHSQDEAILILPDFITDKFPCIQETIPKEIFQKVILFPYRKIDKRKEFVLQSVDTAVKRLFPDIDLKTVQEINIAGAQYYFAYWLTQNNIPYNFFEEASGRLTQPEPVINNVRDINPVQYEIAAENGLFIGNNPSVQKKFCNYKAQIPGFSDALAEDFDIVAALQKIPRFELERILTFFQAPSELKFDNNSAILLTQHFANLNMMAFEEQAILYQMTVDYYLDRKSVFIKPHPDDLMFYQYIIPDCQIITGRFPSELLPFISERSAGTLATISSTGLSNISNLYQYTLAFNTDYEKTFYQNHKYYLGAKLCRQFEDYDIYAFGINEQQLTNMLAFSDCNSDAVFHSSGQLEMGTAAGGRKMFLIGDIPDSQDNVLRFLQAIDDTSIVCFFNFDKQYIFYKNFDRDIWKSIIPKKIRIEAIDKRESDDIGYEYVFIYSRNTVVRKEIADMHYVKRLINTGIETSVPEMADVDIQLAALKGILDATERRLLFCLKNTKSEENKNE